MKKLSNTVAELKERVAFTKGVRLNTVVEVHSSILRSTGSQFIFLKLDGLIWPQGEGSKQTGMYLFWAICNLVFMALLKRGFLFFLNINDYNWTRQKMYYQEITKKETRKYSASTYLTALSNRTVKKELGGGGCQREKNNIYKA